LKKKKKNGIRITTKGKKVKRHRIGTVGGHL
jgi:hypothetical protein